MKTIRETIEKWNELYAAAQGSNLNEKMQSVITALANNSEYVFYVYKGEVGILCYLDDDTANAKGYASDGQIAFVPAYDMEGVCKDLDNGACATYEDSYDAYCGCMSIDLHTVTNIENEQRLLHYTWVSDVYAESDEYQRELLTITDKYYDWTSERSRMIDKIIDAMDRGIALAGLKKEWCWRISLYKDPLGVDTDDKAQFYCVVSEALAASGCVAYGKYTIINQN